MGFEDASRRGTHPGETEPMTILLDTNVLIDVLNRRKGRREFLSELVSRNDRLACCSVTVAEVYAGMRTAEAGDTNELLNSLEYFDLSRNAARRAGLLKGAWARKGITLELPDVLIAAVAIEHDLALATDNRKHYPMPELRMIPLPDRSR
jgi:predicted nucleic acid-binding protein